MPRKPKQSSEARIPLSRDRVLQAALALADEVGIDSLSMRKLGDALGVKAMSLYKYVANKDEVFDGIVELVAAEFYVPETGADWKKEFHIRATTAHEVLLRHPWATTLIVSRANVGPNMLRYVDATLGCLRDAGFSYTLLDHAWNAVDSYVYGFTLQKLNFPFKEEEYAGAAKAYLPQIVDTYPYLAGLSRHVIDGHHSGIHSIEFGLKLVLDGLEKLRDETSH